TGQTICIYSFDSLFHKAGISSTWTTDPADYLAGLNDGDGDYAIGIAFDIGDLGDGEFVDLSYGYALGGSLSNASGSVPEPSTLLLLGLGALGLGATRRLRAPA
ncbi:MAG: PEP-CTERM sorting domain-containing protein, partial [Gammaproteobacteria bacterium]